ncbi:Beta-glucan synthesis-associated protein KRE6 [Psilocybe cubensis]|uniref:Beta-glucan synthesis-associated protein KRE6 n=1 Tax=Psilocybe cubensis TaxID=181762 RepID=A0ACB8GLJ7_PSICU|nr:Beta-glucan synthesis-associated protein KRE6 [Psilocybe cubensis]KAH9476339.1 Beta-glucan synthesis-associated protein KRE6 [Psilocybe cubensis]
MPDPIDSHTPQSARTRTGFDGHDYELVFSDEFETDGRTFYPGDDPFWEAVDLWYGATQDLEWYDPAQVTTRGGALVITMDSVNTTEKGVTPGSTAPFTLADNHNMPYRSGMVQTWNKFCFTTGYIEVSVSFPGPDQQTQGYWPGAWTMGNLARPGYPATTDGLWPYTYDSCDVGTFPNQTNPDGQTPIAAVHSDASRPNYNYDLSWLPGQRLSACSCPGSDHPGPTVSRGRGSPEIDIFEAERDKNFDVGHVVSQSAQFAPFNADYKYSNDSGGWTNFDPTRTRANTYRGSAIQQSVSGLTRTPTDMFQGSGANFKTFGFEYWSDMNDRSAGSITWQVDGQRSHRVLASAVGPDPEENGGSGVGQRIIPEEPMSIVLNLGISNNWQKIDTNSMLFPGEMKIDYVRVYQRKGQTNTGCDPKDYPTADYINRHLEAYTDVNMTTWKWEKPRNSKSEVNATAATSAPFVVGVKLEINATHRECGNPYQLESGIIQKSTNLWKG